MSSIMNNPENNCLENLLLASEHSHFQTTEDIYDQRGLKLLGAGYPISPKIRDRLIDRKLRKPLETSITTDNALRREEIYKEAHLLAQTMPILRRLCPNIEQEVRQLKLIQLQPFASLLLTLMRDNGSNAFSHMVLLTLIASMIGRKMQLDTKTMQELTLAACLHDIGELYVPRDYLFSRKRLSPHEWRNVMVHPLIGSRVIAQQMNYHEDVALAVMEHHERSNGTGYPRKVRGKAISPLGEILIIAEVLAGMLTKPDFPIARALLVFKLIPGEYPSRPLGALHEMVQQARIDHRERIIEPAKLEHIRAVLGELDNLRQKFKEHHEAVTHPTEKSIAENIRLRLMHLKQAVISIGLEHCFQADTWQTVITDSLMHMEVDVTSREVAWRIRDLARDTILDLNDANHTPSPELETLIEIMSGTSVG